MNDFQEGLMRSKAAFAALPDSHVLAAGHTPMTRDEVAAELGEDVALAWDDLQAARTAYAKAVNRTVKRKREEDQ